MKRYDVIFFDLDHTLVDTNKQYELGLASALASTYPHGVPDDFQQRFMHHHHLLWKEYDARQLSMVEVRRQRFLLAWKDYGVERTVDEADAFYQTYTLTMDSTLFPYPGIHEMLASVQQHHRLGIITNGSPDLQWRKLGITKLRPFFPQDSLIISEQIGKAKPDPSVFQAACNALGVAKDNALMIGDNYEKDVLGAEHFGMDALWFVPDANVANEARRMGVSTPVIGSARQLDIVIAELEQRR